MQEKSIYFAESKKINQYQFIQDLSGIKEQYSIG